MNEIEQKTINKFEKFVYEKSPSNDFLVELIQSAGSFLNLKTIPDYAKEHKKSYENIFRNITERLWRLSIKANNRQSR